MVSTATRHRAATLSAALLMFVLLLAAATANATSWYYNRVRIPEGTTMEVVVHTSKNPLKVTVHRRGAKPISFTCTAEGVIALWNDTEFGYGEMRSLHFKCTGHATVQLLGTWTSKLTGTKHPTINTWTGAELEASVRGTKYGAFTGTLEPRIGDHDPEGEVPVEGIGDELDPQMHFLDAGSLEGEDDTSLGVSGTLILGPGHGEGATGEVQPVEKSSE